MTEETSLTSQPLHPAVTKLLEAAAALLGECELADDLEDLSVDISGDTMHALRSAISEARQEIEVVGLTEETKTPGDAPVAWRIQELSGKWVATIDQDTATRWRERGWTVEPLYSAPALEASQARQRELEAQVRVAYGFDRDAVFANIDGLTAKAEAAERRVRELEEALRVAQAAIDAAPHGDNCFLHSDGGEFDRCFCGKDSVSEYVAAALLNSPAGEQPEGWWDIASAPRDGSEITVLYDDGSVEDRVYWSNERCCVLGARAGSFPPGWVSTEAGHLPVGQGPYIIKWRRAPSPTGGER